MCAEVTSPAALLPMAVMLPLNRAVTSVHVVPLVDSHELVPDCVADDFGGRAQIEPELQVLAMGLRGLGADREPRGDLLGRGALGDQLDYLAFAARERAGGAILIGAAKARQHDRAGRSRTRSTWKTPRSQAIE